METSLKSPLFIPKKQALTSYNNLERLVENRSSFNLPNFELNLFETHQKSKKVSLTFDTLTVTAMIRGKKVMQSFDKKNVVYDYLPGESVIVPANEELVIDFPEASEKNPTQCLAIAIDNQKIKSTLETLNNQFPKLETPQNKNGNWTLENPDYHLKNNAEIKNVIDRITHISIGKSEAKNLLADLALQELLIRIMQTQARNLIFEEYKKYSTQNRFAYVIEYVENNLEEQITVEKLSKLACMSESNFYKTFKREFGITPVEYILKQRISLAKKLLTNMKLSITDVCYKAGFNSLSYFSVLFKKYADQSPSEFRKSIFGE
ncbi:MAG: AraC family transcriptional regulator [Flexibacter sp. CG_4_10_14_3_um_filter_32_15]|nr:MAG: AraC family transcriptional regulator [Flexibacter sp. CG_4_10_14_3_um_filter_32_15]